MAKAPQKPTPTEKSSDNSKQTRLEKEQEEVYAAHKDEIDLVLKQCTAHLKKLTPEVAREVIRRLEKYYLKHGIPTPKPPKLG